MKSLHHNIIYFGICKSDQMRICAVSMVSLTIQHYAYLTLRSVTIYAMNCKTQLELFEIHREKESERMREFISAI